MRTRALIGVAVGALALAVPAVVQAAGPPILGEAWSSAVQATSARVSAEIDPNGLTSSYHFDYIKESAYEANIAGGKGPFTGALRVPLNGDAIAAVNGAPSYTQQLSALAPQTAYRYRVVATNSAGTKTGAAHRFVTPPLGGGALLPDSRGWEMVSPIDKNGGQVDPPGAIAGGGVLQVASNGQSVTYSSSASFAGGQGAPPASQYVATRGGDGWSTQNITAPIFSGTYDLEDRGVPYQLFSTDLARGLLLNGRHCRGKAGQCAVANPPLAGTDAPVGYQNYYLHEATGITSLLGPDDVLSSGLGPAHFDVAFTGASPDLQHVVLSSCAALTSDATEVPLGEGCDPEKQNLYAWSQGGGLTLVNSLPAGLGAESAAQMGAVSGDGSRIYWVDSAGALRLREGSQAKLVDGEGIFETASTDSAVAFFSKAGHLHRYDAQAQNATDLTPAGGVKGMLGASAKGDYVYYQDTGGLKLWHGGVTTTVAPGADASEESNVPPATGTARVSADGTHLLFSSKESLTGFDNTDLNTGQPDSELFLYNAGANGLTCVSCNPTNARPIGGASVPGAIQNGTAPGSTHSYKPRVLSSDGRRVFFDSADALASTDVNSDSSSGTGISDVYQWEAQGLGSCAKPGGCIALLSSGRSPGGATFVDASTDGSDAFFLTDDSLVGSDPGAIDLYDARVGGGFTQPPPPIPCQGDACQFLPSEPVEPTLTTLLEGPGNPKIYYAKYCKPGYLKRKGVCVRKRHGKERGAHKRRRHGGKR